MASASMRERSTVSRSVGCSTARWQKTILFVRFSSSTTSSIWQPKNARQTGPMGPEKTIEALRNYIAAFLDTNLRGKSLDPLLTGPPSEYPDAEVTTQKQSLCGKTIDH
jgi:hypothetical protein